MDNDDLPTLVNAREIIAAFHAMIRRKAATELAPWIDRARTSLVPSFANGIGKDQAAVHAAISLHWSNGQTEGQITKLMLVKRQMCAARPAYPSRPYPGNEWRQLQAH